MPTPEKVLKTEFHRKEHRLLKVHNYLEHKNWSQKLIFCGYQFFSF